MRRSSSCVCFFFQAEDGIRDGRVTGVQTCALPIYADSMAAAVDRLAADIAADPDQVKGAIVSSAKKTFFAGGDLRLMTQAKRSEERRVGKECRSRWLPYQLKKKVARARKSARQFRL